MGTRKKIKILLKKLISEPRKTATSIKIVKVLYGRLAYGRQGLRPSNYSDNLKKFHNAHRGKRCFIIGNGPSLNKTDLALLRDEYTIGVNGIFYKYDDILFKPTYYVVEDNHVIADNIRKINEIDYSTKLFPVQYADVIEPNDDTYFFDFDTDFYDDIKPNYQKPRFSKDISKVVYAGQTVTYVNIQLAFYLGFQEVYLIGVDFSYQIPDSAKIDGLTIISQEDDPNHFHPDYFGKGKKWHDPKLENCLNAYRFAKQVFEKEDRKIYNATVGGKLEVFKRADYYSLFKQKPFLKKPNNVEQYTISQCLESLMLSNRSRGPVMIELGNTNGNSEGESTALLTRFANASRPRGAVYVIGAERGDPNQFMRLLKEDYRLDTKNVKLLEGSGLPEVFAKTFNVEETFDLAILNCDGQFDIDNKSIEVLIGRMTPSSMIIFNGRGDARSPKPTGDLISILSSLVDGKKALHVWVNQRIVVASERLSLPMMDRLSMDKVETNSDFIDISSRKMERIIKRGIRKHRLYCIVSPPDSPATSTNNSLLCRLISADVPFLVADRNLYIYY